MHSKIFTITKLIALVLASLVTIFTMLRASGQSVDAGVILFMLFGLSPYLSFLIASYLVERYTSFSKMAAIDCTIAGLMLGITLFAYIGSLSDTSSTGALIFLFVPIWLLLGSFLLMGLGLLVSWLSNRRAMA